MLPVVLYEPPWADRFFPVADFLPFWEMRCGAFTFLERMTRFLDARPVLFPREEMQEAAAAFSPSLQVAGTDSLPDEAVFVSAAWVPPPGTDIAAEAEKGSNPHCRRMRKTAFLELLASRVLDEPYPGEDGRVVRKPWELVVKNPAFLAEDAAFFEPGAPEGVEVVGPAEDCRISPRAEVGPFVVADCRNGPVVVEEGVRLAPFTFLEGPLFIGRGTIVKGGRFSSSSFGPDCRLAGEVADTVFQECVNKAHDGYIGHAWVAPFVNFGALTTNSDLKNTYGEIRLRRPGGTEPTGLMKFGFICGPHTRFGIGSLIPTGALVGGFCNLFAGSSFLPRYVEHFRWYDGRRETMYRFEDAVKVAAKVTARRNRTFSAAETRRALAVYRKVFAPPE